MNLFRDADADLTHICDAPVAVMGYGNQGHAHALNLRDSGVCVIVGQRANSPRFEQATRDGFAPVPMAQAVREARLVILALPDDVMPAVFSEHVAPALRQGQALGFIHGFNVHFGTIKPPAGVDVVMVAPKGPGRLLRSAFAAGSGIACLVACAADATGRARDTALGWAKGIGCTRVAALETTFAHETITDLFGEQAVLCGGMVALMQAAFDTLVDGGYPEELAYFECVHEVKQIVDLIYEGGLEFMRRRISSTARFGGLERGPRMVPPQTREAMREALSDIETGAFAQRFAADTAAGGPQMRHMQATERSSRLAAAQQRVFEQLLGRRTGEAGG